MSPIDLLEVDTLTTTIIIDNEIDILSTVPPNTVSNNSRMPNLSLSQPSSLTSRGSCKKEMPMEAICCGAHGLSILVTVTKNGKEHSILFDAGPEEEAFERNAKRLGINMASIERIVLSHWHWDHSGGLLAAIRLITSSSSPPTSKPIIDLHPSRPTYRGFMVGETPISMQADPSFEEIEQVGGKVEKNEDAHTVLDGTFLVSGRIERVTGYEKGVKGGIRFDEESGEWMKDEEIWDERFLVVNLKGKGLVLFTGCSHGGVVNAALQAKKLLKDEVPLYAIVGGYHLVGEQEANIQATIRDLKKIEPRILLPGHCSGWRAKVEIEKEMPGRLVLYLAGLELDSYFDAEV